MIGWSKRASTPNEAKLPSFCVTPQPLNLTEDKENWYEQLPTISLQTASTWHDFDHIIGDMYVKVGYENPNSERNMGKYGCGVVNDDGERHVDFCLNNICVIGSTFFAHRDFHELTWISHDDRTNNQIYHIIINEIKWLFNMWEFAVELKFGNITHQVETSQSGAAKSAPETTRCHKAYIPSHQTAVYFGAEKPLQCIRRHIRGVWRRNNQQVEHHQENLCWT